MSAKDSTPTSPSGALITTLAAVHEVYVSSVAAAIGIAEPQMFEHTRRALLCRGAMAFAAVLSAFGEGTEIAHVSLARDAYRGVVTGGSGHEAARNTIWRKADALIFERLTAARHLAVTRAGCKQIFATGVLPDLPGFTDEKKVSQWLNASQLILSGRVAKEALRLELSAQRKMKPLASFCTSAATKLLQRNSAAHFVLADRGFCVVDGAISLEDCRVLYDHFDGALCRGELFGHVSSDACNKGSFSLSLPILVGADREPDEDIIMREIVHYPTKRRAFAQAFALRNAVRILTGMSVKLIDSLSTDVDHNNKQTFPVEVPPTAMCACYPPHAGACYHKHKDWYHYETSNEREITAILYINPNWTDKDGGELVIHCTNDVAETISPIAGRVVLFFSRTVWHEVRPCKTGNRYALTLWLDRNSLHATKSRT